MHRHQPAADGPQLLPHEPGRDRGNLDYLWIYLPAGTPTLHVTTTGGTGNAYLYYDPTIWASSTTYTAASTLAAPARA